MLAQVCNTLFKSRFFDFVAVGAGGPVLTDLVRLVRLTGVSVTALLFFRVYCILSFVCVPVCVCAYVVPLSDGQWLYHELAQA